MNRASVIVVAALLGAGAARAEEVDRGQFVILSRTTPASHFVADMSMVRPDGVPAYGLRLDLYAQWVFGSHFGLYGQFGWTWLRNQGITLYDLVPEYGVPDEEINDPFASNNLGFGALYTWDLGPASVTATLGVMLSTSPDDWNFLANAFLVMGRVSEWEQFSTQMTWLRGGVVVTGGPPVLFYQGDLSYSRGFVTNKELAPYDVLHVNGGVGTTLGPVRVLVELASTMTHAADEDTWFHALSFGLRYGAGSWSPHVSYQIPFRFADGVAGHVLLAGVVHSFGRSQ